MQFNVETHVTLYRASVFQSVQYMKPSNTDIANGCGGVCGARLTENLFPPVRFEYLDKECSYFSRSS